MKEKTTKYRILAHCPVGQIQEGFNICINSLPTPVDIQYVNLAEEGIVSKLRFKPHLIVVLLNKEDSEIMLPHKIKLFAADIPLLIILPKIPNSYLSFLRKIGVEKVIQLPAGNEEIKNEIISLLPHTKFTDFRE